MPKVCTARPERERSRFALRETPRASRRLHIRAADQENQSKGEKSAEQQHRCNRCGSVPRRGTSVRRRAVFRGGLRGRGNQAARCAPYLSRELRPQSAITYTSSHGLSAGCSCGRSDSAASIPRRNELEAQPFASRADLVAAPVMGGSGQWPMINAKGFDQPRPLSTTTGFEFCHRRRKGATVVAWTTSPWKKFR